MMKDAETYSAGENVSLSDQRVDETPLEPNAWDDDLDDLEEPPTPKPIGYAADMADNSDTDSLMSYEE